MGGRGRGRGRGLTLSFNLETLGIQRSDVNNAPILGPQPLYPNVSTMPIPDMNYSPDSIKLVEIALRMKGRWRKRAALMTLEEKKKDIERYSDKYQLNQQKGLGFTPDWNQFPDELCPIEVRQRKRKARTVRPNLKAARTSLDTRSILAKAKARLEMGPAEDDSKDDDEEIKEEQDDEEKEEDEEGEEEEEEEELDEEEETDYNLTYFDNGEDYGDDDNEDDEPAYHFG